MGIDAAMVQYLDDELIQNVAMLASERLTVLNEVERTLAGGEMGVMSE